MRPICLAGAFAAVCCTQCVPAEMPRTPNRASPASSASVDQRPTSALRLPPSGEDDADTAAGSRDETSFEFEPEFDADTGDEPILDGVPALSPRVLGTLRPFLESRRARLAAVSSDGGQMIVLTRLDEVVHAHLLAAPLGARTQITFGNNPVTQVTFAPGTEDAIIYRSDVGGNELYQLFHLDLQTRETRRLTDGTSHHGGFITSGPTGLLTYTNNARNGRDMDIYTASLESAPPVRRLVAMDGQNELLGWSRDGASVLTRQFRSTTGYALQVVDVATGAVRPLAALRKGITFRAATFHPDGQRLFVTSDHDSDSVSLYEVSADFGEWRSLTPHIPWDVESVTASRDGLRLAFTTNEDGVSILRVLDIESGHQRTLRDLGRGVITGLRFAGNAQTLAFTRTTPTETADVFTYDLEHNRLVRWTESELGGIPGNWFIAPESTRIRTFDGLELPTVVYRPQRSGRHPALIWVHGGPEAQSRPVFEPIVQYFVRVLGIAVVIPNIRGSAGYGKRYRHLDDGKRRFDAIRDIGAVLDWIARDPKLDAERVGVYGASYGGFVALSSLAEYGTRLRAGCSVVGLSNLVTFLEGTRSYWQDHRRLEYGDERDPAVRAYLESISPLGRAQRITSPLLVAHGANDPRVPLSEAHQIVDAVRQLGQEAWLFVATDDGHGFRKRKNRDQFYRIMATFFERHLTPGGTPSRAQAVVTPVPTTKVPPAACN
ncbi:MAG: S9 family peptidase [Polyangiaceae bacterium]|nr:S9 family peptidase [Polyangiaceae bacterium]